MRDVIGADELRSVNILVTVFAFVRGRAEAHVPQCDFHVRWPMASGARSGAMRTNKRVIRLVMIETDEVAPGLLGMARLTSLRRARCGERFGHLLVELSLVYVSVTGGAIERGEVIRDDRELGLLRLLLVAIDASDSDMAPGEREARLLVSRQGEAGRLESQFAVTRLAAIEIRRGGELPLVRVLVAVGATIKLDLVPRSLARGRVTLGARDVRVLSLQWERGQVVLDEEELRGLETFHRVAGFALASIGALRELSIVWIGLVTVGALGEGERLLEIAFQVTLHATDVLVFAKQWILGGGVIELSLK